ncbi:MAG: hypothetical protein AUK24_09365 [Syntrophaceae bacterium CG2_30_49_12]|nr:MAG: hypothetical protein AUK24_09365 [Syntrophaceae bacterium CG2_30_49_12]PIP07451.1 MAG: hypothetical protein COX52_03675 [Syntrophobacterales bacterium CG23_combo_of_CG06-09_8_20_14_all_48_27]
MEGQEKKSLILAWVLNVAPGFGLIYVGKKWLGVLFLILGGIFFVFCLTGIGAIVGLPLYLLTSLIACISSAVYASKYNKSLL